MATTKLARGPRGEHRLNKLGSLIVADLRRGVKIKTIAAKHDCTIQAVRYYRRYLKGAK